MKDIFYVYIHTRLDDGKVFYVGKGSKGRAFSKHSRSRFWRFVSEKAGWVASIIQDGMTEKDANLLEMWLIAKFRHNGVNLVNLTDGGDGFRAPNPSLRKPVFCSNGIKYESINEAAEDTGVDASKISSVARGFRHSTGGLSFWFVGSQERPFVDPRLRMINTGNRSVIRSDGQLFSSIKSAAESVNGRPANITGCAVGRIKKAYGYTWRYAS